MLSFSTIIWPIFRDLIELAVISSCCYYWFSWLAADTQKKLPLYFYYYCALWAFAFFAPLPTVLMLLQTSLPWILVLFITIHQKTIQRNLIGLYKIRPVQQDVSDWLEQLLRFCLQTNHNIHLLIEHTDTLDELLNIALPMQAPVTFTLMHYLVKCSAFNPEQLILLTSQGQLKGINVQWIKHLALEQLETDILEKNSYHLNDNNGIFLRYDAEKRRFDLVLKQQIYHALNVTQTLQSIHNYITHQSTKAKKELAHAPHTEKEQAPHA